MTGEVVDFFDDVMEPDRLASKISDYWITNDNLRQQWKVEKDEVRRYVFATDTTKTSNSVLPWKNKTTVPKLCNIRDNLYSNYSATIFPQRKWLIWEANEKDANSVQKRNAILNYMTWAIEQPEFKHEIDKLILDYIDLGNAIVTVEWVNETKTLEDGTTRRGFVGPRPRRINPMDAVMNPVAENFAMTPKVIRSMINKGSLKKKLENMADEDNRAEYEALFTYLMDIREKALNYQGDFYDRDSLYTIDGFTSYRDYLLSDWVEILTFYGDIYNDETNELMQNRVITVVDRHKLIGNKPNPSFFANAPIFHSPWRKRQDNLWGMGPLDNLVGMQYRLDHIENMRADVVDLTTYPVQMITGFVEEYTWQPGQKIFGGDDGKVELVQPDVQVLNANFDLQRYEATMEEMAGAPKEAVGFRTPGEKTKYEVQRLENAAARVFQNKIKQFEEQIIEPLLNAMLELARRNLNDAVTIKVFDDETKATSFETLTVEDITGIGRIKPIAARHFAEEAQLIQNLTNLAGSGLWPMVQMHMSGVKLAKTFENIFQMENYEIFLPYIGLAEQADAQKMINVLQEQVALNAMSSSGRGVDYDLALQQAPPPPPPGAAPLGAPPPQVPQPTPPTGP